MEAAGIEPTPGDAKLPAESRPYLATAWNAWESPSHHVPSCPALFQVIPQSPATYVQHGGRGERSDSWAATSDAGLSVGMSCRLQFGEAGERKIRIVDVHVRFGGPLPEGRDVLASFEP